MRSYLMAGNWKMYKTPEESAQTAAELSRLLKECPQDSSCGSSVEIMIAPSFTSLQAVGEALRGTPILLGAQNMAAEEEGAHTGETSVLMLKALGVDAVILGHSERRHIYGERNELINRKVKLALRHGLRVILCIGETLNEREAGQAESVCTEQIEKGLEGVDKDLCRRVSLAYEPVWAIGTGKTATAEDAEAVHQVSREKIKELFGSEISENMIIQYGGSVKPGNVQELMSMKNIDGALVGGASLDAESFCKIICFNHGSACC